MFINIILRKNHKEKYFSFYSYTVNWLETQCHFLVFFMYSHVLCTLFFGLHVYIAIRFISATQNTVFTQLWCDWLYLKIEWKKNTKKWIEDQFKLAFHSFYLFNEKEKETRIERIAYSLDEFTISQLTLNKTVHIEKQKKNVQLKYKNRPNKLMC